MSIFQGLPRSTRFLESIVSYLPDWRKAAMPFPVIAWNTFIDHVRVNINPLAADDHMKEVIQQLQLMGEVIYVKGRTPLFRNRKFILNLIPQRNALKFAIFLS